MAGGRGGHAIVDNVDQLKNSSPHCPQNFDLRGGGRGNPAQFVDNMDNVDHAYLVAGL
jgi:hypothetical protein